MPHQIETDFLVVGSGIAGLTFALHAAEAGRVLVVTKRRPEDSSTAWAQGGIAAVLDPGDSFEAHIADTIAAGDGLCKEEVVRLCVREGPAAVADLIERYGVRFDRRDEDGELDLAREGGHSARRVVHAKDTTGWEIERALLAAAERHPQITILSNHMAVDLLTMAKYGGPDACFGAYVLERATGEVHTVVARATVLATGGAGKVYLYTSNPDVATADGVAMAYRAGAQVANMEFFQFHPTCLYHPEAKSFLISEALRGEGGILRLTTGQTFMERYHPMKSLAPRDVVARAIDAELKRTGADFVLLDMTHLPSDFLVQRFPTIHARCLSLGIDMRTQPIPVVPAAHYSCGGVLTDSFGRTSLRNLYAVGENAMSGLHGACRLASNSLLEGVVLSRRAAQDAVHCTPIRPPQVAPWYSGAAQDPDEAVVVTQNWDEVRRVMWNYVGIVRTDKRLERARRRIELIRDEIREYYWNFKVTSDLLELRNIALAAHLIIESAQRRRESRGLHWNSDHPNKDDAFRRDTVLRRGDGPSPA
ncbi:MAG: L-aspartate oxidase [Myxococcales bacterium]|nr:L-aspartate oxidase [Myxococcota bacterium]MDW8283042.1 L-aspartate oxidase [Myxococcales bacterium]